MFLNEYLIFVTIISAIGISKNKKKSLMNSNKLSKVLLKKSKLKTPKKNIRIKIFLLL